MLRLLSDADVHGELVRGLRRRQPGIDLLRAQDVFPPGTPDLEILTWAAKEGRVVLTNDRNTMIGFAYERLETQLPMAGLIVTSQDQSIGSAISEILLVIECMTEQEIRDQAVVFLPL